MNNKQYRRERAVRELFRGAAWSESRPTADELADAGIVGDLATAADPMLSQIIATAEAGHHGDARKLADAAAERLTAAYQQSTNHRHPAASRSTRFMAITARPGAPGTTEAPAAPGSATYAPQAKPMSSAIRGTRREGAKPPIATVGRDRGRSHPKRETPRRGQPNGPVGQATSDPDARRAHQTTPRHNPGGPPPRRS